MAVSPFMMIFHPVTMNCFLDSSSFENSVGESDWLDSNHEGCESPLLKNTDCQEGSIDDDHSNDFLCGNKADTVREMSDENVSDDTKKENPIFPREFSIQISSEEWNQINEKMVQSYLLAMATSFGNI